MIYKTIIVAFVFIICGVEGYRTSCNETSLPSHVFLEDGIEYVNDVNRPQTAKIVMSWNVSIFVLSLLIIVCIVLQ